VLWVRAILANGRRTITKHDGSDVRDPRRVPGNTVSYAAFVGADFQTSWQHLQSGPLAAQ